MTSIPAGTQFQGVIPSNGYKNKKSALLNSLSPLYTIEDIAAASGGGALTVETLTLQGTDATTTSQAIYGINVIDTATTSALATRLPAPTTGKQTTFVNTSSMSILVFPSVTGGEINGVVENYHPTTMLIGWALSIACILFVLLRIPIKWIFRS